MSSIFGVKSGFLILSHFFNRLHDKDINFTFHSYNHERDISINLWHRKIHNTILMWHEHKIALSQWSKPHVHNCHLIIKATMLKVKRTE